MSFVSYGATPGASAASGIEDSLTGVKKAAADQLAWNRPTTSNPWAQQFSAPDGSIHQEFTGAMGGAQGSLMGQALRQMGSPTDFSQYNPMSGDAARSQAIGAAQGQMGEWFGGMKGGLDEQAKARLSAQGYQPGSPEYAAEEMKANGWNGDMQASIGNAAIGLGTQGGALAQSRDMQTQQQKLAEALRERSMPMDQLKAMQGLGEQPGVAADDSILGSAGMDYKARLGDYLGKRGDYEQAQADEMASGLGLGTDLFKSAMTFGTNAMQSRAAQPKPKPSKKMGGGGWA